MDKVSLTFLLAGLVGGALKAFLSNSQENISVKSLGDVVIAGLVGLLWPALGPIPIPEKLTLIQQAGFITFISYTGSHVVTSVLGKIGYPLNAGPSSPPHKG